MVYFQFPGQTQGQIGSRRRHITSHNLATPGDVVVEPLLRLGTPVGGHHLITHHDYPHIPIDRQVLLHVEHVCAITILQPVGPGLDQPHTFAHAGLG